MGRGGEMALTRRLLRCGIAAGPVYLAVGAAQILTRDGFDMRLHALSLLSNGDYGWIQTANFLVSGLLVLAGAAGVRRLLHPGAGGTWGALLLALYGLGLIGAAFFPADPGRGFPPGTPMESSGMSQAGLMHFVCGGIGFYALIAACFVFARRFARQRRDAPGRSIRRSRASAFFLAFAAIASGSTSAAVMLIFYAAVAWVWIWHAALSAALLSEASGRAHGSGRRHPRAAAGARAFRSETYAQLVARVPGEPVHIERIGPAGVPYQIEIVCIWDGAEGGDVHVMASIDDGGWRAVAPFTRSFIKTADGRFVGG